MAAVRRPAAWACTSCSSLLASVLFIAVAIFALAAVANGAAGEPDPDPERVRGPADCPLECGTKLTSYIMETIKCYIACMGGGGGGGGGGGFAAVAKGAGEPNSDPERVRGPADCPVECATKLTSYIMETVKCYIACMGGGGGGGGELSITEEGEHDGRHDS